MADAMSIRGYQFELDRHRLAARRDLEDAARHVAAALAELDGERSAASSAASEAGRAVIDVANGYARVQAYAALCDVGFLAEPDEKS